MEQNGGQFELFWGGRPPPVKTAPPCLCPPPCTQRRLAWVVGFSMGPFGAVERPWKPFNPILGETFELHSGEGGRIKYLAEQVRVLHVLRVTIVMYCTYIVRNLYCMHGEGERTY